MDLSDPKLLWEIALFYWSDRGELSEILKLVRENIPIPTELSYAVADALEGKPRGLSPNHKTMEYKRLIKLRSRIVLTTKNQVRAIKKDIANKSKSIESQHKALHSYLRGTRGISINAAVSDYLNDATVQNTDFTLMWLTMKLRSNGLLITETIVQRANCKSLHN